MSSQKGKWKKPTTGKANGTSNCSTSTAEVTATEDTVAEEPPHREQTQRVRK